VARVFTVRTTPSLYTKTTHKMSSSPRLAAATAFLDAFSTLNVDSVMSLKAPNCTHHIVPSSLGAPKFDNVAYTAFLQHVVRVMKTCAFTVKEMMEDAGPKKVVVWCSSNVSFHREEVGAYEGEYVFMLDFDGEDKVVRVVEFVDSKASGVFMGQVAEATKLVGEAGRKEGV
jgi:hypothetical protein